MLIKLNHHTIPSAAARPRVAVPGETNLPTQVTTDTTVAYRVGTQPVAQATDGVGGDGL